MMKNLVNPNAITAKTTEEVYKQVIEELESRGYATANNADETINYLSAGGDDVTLDDIHTNIVQTIELDGEERYNYVPLLTVEIAENYVDSGSDDYVYTISVIEQ